MENARLEALSNAESYVRQLAWLYATPDTKYKPEKESKSRIAQGYSVEFPDCAHHYLIDHLSALGFTEAAGMGEGIISHQSIFAYQFNMGIRLEPWEVAEIRRLSGVYLSQQKKSLNPSEPVPYRSDAEIAREKRQEKATQDITRIFSGMVKK